MDTQDEEEYCRDDDFRAYLQKTVSGCSSQMEEAVSEPTIGNLVEHVKNFKVDMESSFEKERSGMQARFKNEKNDILKGFLIEKKILNQEHEAEKNTLLHSFVKERQKMLDTFEQQVKDIECDLLNKKDFPKSVIPPSNSSETVTTMRVEKKKIIGALGDHSGNPIEDAMRDVSIEKKMITTQERQEQDYYRKLERIKEELEGEYNLNLRREREKKEEHILKLQKEIDSLKGIKCSVADTWKEQAAKLEERFQMERNELGKHYKEERDKLRRKLEEKNEMKLDAQKQEYDQSIGKLKNELQRIKSDAMRKGQEATSHSIQSQNDLIQKLQANFEMDTKVLREQNDKLTEDIKVLTSDKYEQSSQIRELHDKLEREMKNASEMSVNMKKEFSTKMKCLLSDNEKLKHAVKNVEAEKETLNRKLRSCCRSAKDNVEKLTLSERTIQQCEDTVTSMRNENKNLSHEITLLRKEKDDLLRRIDEKLESERTTSLDMTRLQTEIKDWNNRYALLEREKLQNEKMVAKIRKEADTHLTNFTQCNNKITAFETEASKLRQLYETERQENIRLHERFNQDAELIRQKEAENVNNRALINKIKTEFETLKGKMEYDNEKIMQIESEKHSLESMVHKLKSAESVHVKHEILAVQNKYVKEFAKRLDYVKKNYEREIQQLKNEIKELSKSGKKQHHGTGGGGGSKDSDLMSSGAVGGSMNDVLGAMGDDSGGKYVPSHVCTEMQCNQITLHSSKPEKKSKQHQQQHPQKQQQQQQLQHGTKNEKTRGGHLSKIPELFLDIGDMTSSGSGSGSGGSTVSCTELPTRDWEGGDTCEAVVASVMGVGGGRRGGGGGPGEMTNFDGEKSKNHSNNNNNNNHINHNNNNHHHNHHNNTAGYAQTKSINTTQNCHMTTSAHTPYQDNRNDLAMNTLPTIPNAGGGGAKRKEEQQSANQQHLNSEGQGKKKKKTLEREWRSMEEIGNGYSDGAGCSKDHEGFNGGQMRSDSRDDLHPPDEPPPTAEGNQEERNFNHEHDRIKEELAEEFNQNMQRECENGEQLVALQRDIETLKGYKSEFNNTWEERATQLQQTPEQQNNRKVKQQRHHHSEQHHQQQQHPNRGGNENDGEFEEYESCGGGCRNVQEGQIEADLHHPKGTSSKDKLLRNKALRERSDAEMELIRKLQENFDRDSRILREQNNKCMEEIKVLTSEKFEQSRHIRELYDKIEDQNKSATETTVKMKQEFNTRVKILLEDNDKLKKKQKGLESERNELRRKMESCCRSAKDSAEKLSMSQHTVTQCEDSLLAMRNENKNLSREIALLRKEKSELLHKIDEKLEVERALSLDKAKLLTEIKDWTSKYASKEKETLQNQKIVAKIRKEVDSHLSDFTQVNDKLAVFQNEAAKLRQLYETERQENMRLHERFNQDAELIRQKEAENNNNRVMLNKIKSDFENLKRKMEEDNVRILRMEGEKQSLQNTIEKLKTNESEQFKVEMYAVHGKYAKEFTKRLHAVKTKYSKEIEQLKQEIKRLRQGAGENADLKKSQSYVNCDRCVLRGIENNADVNNAARVST